MEPLPELCSKSANIEESSSLNSSSGRRGVDVDVLLSGSDGVESRRESRDSISSNMLNASIVIGDGCGADERANKIAEKRKGVERAAGAR